MSKAQDNIDNKDLKNLVKPKIISTKCITHLPF